MSRCSWAASCACWRVLLCAFSGNLPTLRSVPRSVEFLGSFFLGFAIVMVSTFPVVFGMSGFLLVRAPGPRRHHTPTAVQALV